MYVYIIPQHRAQTFFRDNIFGIFGGQMLGILSVSNMPKLQTVLNYTQSASSKSSAYRRFMLTMLHTMNWYEDDLRPGSRSWRSLATVRKRHVTVSMKSAKAQNKIISQLDMAVAQFGFVGYGYEEKKYFSRN